MTISFRYQVFNKAFSVLCFSIVFMAVEALGITQPQQDTLKNIPHLMKNGTATQLIVDGKPFIMLAGELHNSSASNLDYMEPIWDKLSDLNLNTVIASVSWELVEPEQGRFDFTLVDGLIDGAREHNMRLVLLWFGSWKNAVSSYVPAWVKKDFKRFPRVQDANGESREVLSSFSEESLVADSRAFASFMRHLREIDSDQHTVIMVQVENETGLLGDSRDRSPLAEKAFTGNVPTILMDYLQQHKDLLIPEMYNIWGNNGFRMSGSWEEVFGDDSDEVFMAWYIGRYVGKVAAAGKAEYPLPMFVNAWLIQDEFNKPGAYPSGGPVSKLMDVWRAAAKEIDIFAPDIYSPNFKAVCKRYTRSGNPLFIPEARRDLSAVAKAFYTFAEHDAICFAPYGIDDIIPDHPLGKAYKLLGEIQSLITMHQGTGNMVGFMETEEKTLTVELGDYQLEISYDMFDKKDMKSFGFIISIAPDEYVMAGSGFWVTFSPKLSGLHAGILSVDEGQYKNGKWLPGRRLNGDGNDGGLRIQFPCIEFNPSPRKLTVAEGPPPRPIAPNDFIIQRVKVYNYR